MDTRDFARSFCSMDDVLDHVSDVFYAVDQDWRLVYLNRKAEAWWHRTKEELLGTALWDLFPDFEQTIYWQKLHQAAQERITMHWETLFIELDAWLHVDAYPTMDGGLAVFFQDITERKKAEEALQVSERRQAFFLQLSDQLRPLADANAIQDTVTLLLAEHLHASQANYTEYDSDTFTIQRENRNDQAPSMKGTYKRSDFSAAVAMLSSGRDMMCSDVLESHDIPNEQRAYWMSFNIRANLTVPIIRRNELVATLSVRQASPHVWTQYEIDLVHETAERTWLAIERARAEMALRDSEANALALIEKLRKADEQKNTFLSVLSHELRNPLASIVLGLSLIDMLEPGSDQAIKTTKIIDRQAKQLSRLVDDLLDLTRITQNRIELKMANVALNTLLEHLVQDHRPGFETKGIHLDAYIDPEALRMEGDPARLNQAIGNLLHNALKFTPKNGSVLLALEKSHKSNHAIISIQDNGEGIAPDLLNKLFEPFVQVEQSLGRSLGGLGLGLSIAKGIIEKHGGRICASSDGLGHGARFTICLPLSH